MSRGEGTTVRRLKESRMLGWSFEEAPQKTLNAMRDCETQVASEMTAVINGNG